MTATRRNITANSQARDNYIAGVNLLKAENTGLTTNDLGLPGGGVGNQPVGTWDLFVYWHVAAMNQATPPGSGRNAAHRGPAFLPWHRWMLILLEFQLQRVLNDENFGLPYWDWAADGEVPASQQRTRPVWSASCMGGNGRASDGAVTTGPFRAASAFRVRVEEDVNGQLRAANRPLRRRLGQQITGLPRKQDVEDALTDPIEPGYDSAPWDASSLGLRNRVEGWLTPPAGMHNRVHVWIGGDMGPSTSPNDPVFYLNHCNVDRIWAAWQSRNPNRPYRPPPTAPASLFRHRRNDPLHDILTDEGVRPADVLNVANLYTYDSLQVD
jgi:tyrosinase